MIALTLTAILEFVVSCRVNWTATEPWADLLAAVRDEVNQCSSPERHAYLFLHVLMHMPKE